MNKKTQEVLSNIIKDNTKATITVIMKACYLIDLTAQKQIKRSITDLKYIRYNYGPFDPDIYKYLLELIKDDAITTETSYFDAGGNEVTTYKIKDAPVSSDTYLTKKEEKIVKKVLTSIRGLGAKMITEIAYQTDPMKEVKAKIGNKEGLGKRLNLKT